MIDLDGVKITELLEHVDGASNITLSLLDRFDVGSVKDLMSPSQLAELKKAKKDLKAIQGKDFSKMMDIAKKINI